MTITVTLEAFRGALREAVDEHAPQAAVMLEEKRGIILEGRVQFGTDVFIAVYFNALSGKTSYALIREGRRLAGYDNYKFWHYHPPGETNRHVACEAPTPEEAIAKLVEVNASYD
jgi:hypothetical protein